MNASLRKCRGSHSQSLAFLRLSIKVIFGSRSARFHGRSVQDNLSGLFHPCRCFSSDQDAVGSVVPISGGASPNAALLKTAVCGGLVCARRRYLRFRALVHRFARLSFLSNLLSTIPIEGRSVDHCCLDHDQICTFGTSACSALTSVPNSGNSGSR